MVRGKPKRVNAQRPHTPDVLGPRIYFRGRFAAADLRPWGGPRTTLRNPSARNWPRSGERTTDAEVADRWKWKYVDYYRDGTKRRLLGLAPKRQQLGERVEAFLAHRLRTVSDRTRVSDGTGLSGHLVSKLGAAVAIDSIEHEHLQRIVDELLASEYQVTTVSRYVASWAAFFTWAGVRAGDNPASRIVLPKAGALDVRAFSEADLVKLRKAADRFDRRPRDRNFRQRENRPESMRRTIELALSTGGRQAELMALDWERFRSTERTVRFVQQLTRDRRGIKPLKGKIARTTLVLPEWWAFHDERKRGRVLGWSRRPPDLSTAYVQLKDVYLAAAIDFPGAGFHTLRHTYARRFLELGGRIEELQRSLGHARIATTEKHYVHFTPETAAAMARLRIYGDLGESGARIAGGKRPGKSA